MKVFRYLTLSLAILIIAIIALNSYQNSSKANFTGDKNYNIDEDIDIPKIIFVYSDPTPHHPNG
ncbi:MAG: hypothetical protein ACH0QD_04420 [Tepidibacillus sp.]